MNTEIENLTEAAKAFAVSISDKTIETCKEINNTLTIAEVRPHFQTHYANAKLDIFGIMDLVRDILRDKQAELPRGIETTELRNIAIAASLFTSEILAEVQVRFSAGSTRYKMQSVKNCLSCYGSSKTYSKGPKAGQLMGDGSICRIKLSNDEDQPRKCAKPRCKWYRVQGK